MLTIRGPLSSLTRSTNIQKTVGISFCPRYSNFGPKLVSGLFTTSRPVPDVEKEFSSRRSGLLEISAINEDIERYLDSCILQLQLLAYLEKQAVKAEVIGRIKTAIIGATKGM